MADWPTYADSADDKVRAFILSRYREGDGGGSQTGNGTDAETFIPHLQTCPEAVAVDLTGGDSTCSADTCEYVRLDADISCPHGYSVAFQWGDFGEFSDILDLIHNGKLVPHA